MWTAGSLQGLLRAFAWLVTAALHGYGQNRFRKKRMHHRLQQAAHAPAGCGSLTYNISSGLPGVEGARYVLNLGFQAGVGVLANQTQASLAQCAPPSFIAHPCSCPVCVSPFLLLHLPAQWRAGQASSGLITEQVKSCADPHRAAKLAVRHLRPMPGQVWSPGEPDGMAAPSVVLIHTSSEATCCMPAAGWSGCEHCTGA